MKTIKVWVTTNKVGARVEDSFEVEDDATPEEIAEYAQDTMFQMVDWGYSIEGENPDTYEGSFREAADNEGARIAASGRGGEGGDEE